MAVALKPISDEYLRAELRLRPENERRCADRLHRLVARLFDTHIDDLTDERVNQIEEFIDAFRITHADGRRLFNPK